MHKTMVSMHRRNFLQLKTPNTQFTVLRRVLTLLVCFTALAITVRAQAPYFEPSAKAFTPLTEQPGAPVGSYALSGFDNVNLYNGRRCRGYQRGEDRSGHERASDHHRS